MSFGKHALAYLGFLEALCTAQVSVLTANYDNNRTNWNPSETLLAPTNIGVSTFGKVGTVAVDGQIFAQPLYVAGVEMPRLGLTNIVCVVTMENNVYAIDAASLAPVWQVNLGPPVPASLLNFTDISPSIGILSTPVIDAAAGVLYAVSDTLVNGTSAFLIHGLSLTDGHEMLNGPVTIAAADFNPFWHLQRPGLALANGSIYVGFGSHSDDGDYHGWLMAYDASNLAHQLAVFNTTPSGEGGGVWQSGRAPAIDSAGNVYVVSGNGDFNDRTNLGGAVIKLAGSNLSVLDWFAPSDWAYDNNDDVDVGSAGAILAPNSADLLVTGDKAGHLYNLETNSLGHIEIAEGADDFAAASDSIYQLAIWRSSSGALVYQHALNGPLRSYALSDRRIVPEPVSQNASASDGWLPGMAISSNSGAGGVLWETTGDRSQPGIPGTLHAYNAVDLSQELWNSEMAPTRDALGAFAKFAIPLVANGRVYVPTFSNHVVIYGLLAAGHSDTLGANPPSILADETGQATALNQDGSQNSPDQPAARGSTVTLFVTGLGAVHQDVTATIEDQNASLVHVGKARQRGYGVFRIELTVPWTASSGSAVSVSLGQNGIWSAGGVTIAIQ